LSDFAALLRASAGLIRPVTIGVPDPALHEALAHWAADLVRSSTARIEFCLREALPRAGRLPTSQPQLRRKAG